MRDGAPRAGLTLLLAALLMRTVLALAPGAAAGVGRSSDWHVQQRGVETSAYLSAERCDRMPERARGSGLFAPLEGAPAAPRAEARGALLRRCRIPGLGSAAGAATLPELLATAATEAAALAALEPPPLSRLALGLLVPPWTGDLAALQVFSDGSGGHRARAGLAGEMEMQASRAAEESRPGRARVLVGTHADGTRCLLGAAGAPLPCFLTEAERRSRGLGGMDAAMRPTSFAAELLPALWGALWAHATRSLLAAPALQIAPRADALPAVHIAEGRAGSVAEPALAQGLRGAALLAAESGPFFCRRVFCHAGRPWNELADTVAGAAGQGRCSGGASPPLLRDFVLGGAAAWTWLGEAAGAMGAGLLPIEDGCFVFTEPPRAWPAHMEGPMLESLGISASPAS